MMDSKAVADHSVADAVRERKKRAPHRTMPSVVFSLSLALSPDPTTNMDQPIIAFSQDDESHWIAHLQCGHRRHVRHAPPFDDRPWTQTEASRAERLGQEMHCVRCAEGEPPEGIAEYKRTPTFTEETVPKGLLRDHQTRPGVWGQIVVESGALTLSVPPNTHTTLSAGEQAWCAPRQVHAVAPVGQVRFHVRFCRPAST